MRDIEKRLRKLEAKAAPQGSHLLDLLYQVLTGSFGPAFNAEAGQVFETMGRECFPLMRCLPDARERGIGSVLMYGTDRPFDIERFRGIVPERVLAAVYNTQRNRGAPDPATILRVRQFAGVVDEHGAPLPGYVLADNGCILESITP